MPVARSKTRHHLRSAGLLALALLLAGCGQLVDPPTATLPPLPTPRPSPTLQDLSRSGTLGTILDAQSITIRDDWNGISPDAPIERHYTLTRDGESFKGTASFAIGGSQGQTQRTTIAISIPAETAQSFLKAMTQVPLVRGEYKELIDHNDDYPDKQIEIKTASDTFDFYTRSQIDSHWGARAFGREFIINNATVDLALTLLAPYLEKEAFEQLKSEGKHIGQAATPTPQ